MVNLKIDLKGTKVDVNKKSGFEPYEGPMPTPGVYAAVINSCKIKMSKNDNPYFNVMFEFADQTTAEKQKFKGYPLWDRIVPGDSDIQQERVAKFLHVVSGKDPSKVNVAIIHDEIAAGGVVQTIGGKNPVGTRVRVTVLRGNNNGEVELQARDLFPWPKDEPWPTGDVAEADSDEEVEVEEEETEEPDEAEESTEEEEVEETESDEEEEEEEEEEEAEEEPEDDGEFEARQAELRELDRTALKKVLKAANPSFKVLTKHTDEDLANAILDIEFPPVEGEDGDEPPF